MERLLIEPFIQDENIENYKPEAILSLIIFFTRENLQLALKDKSTLGLIKKYRMYEYKVYKGHLGKNLPIQVFGSLKQSSPLHAYVYSKNK